MIKDVIILGLFYIILRGKFPDAVRGIESKVKGLAGKGVKGVSSLNKVNKPVASFAKRTEEVPMRPKRSVNVSVTEPDKKSSDW